MRATEVLPTPRGPLNRKAWATRPGGQGVLQRAGDGLLAHHFLKGLGTPFPGQYLVCHERDVFPVFGFRFSVKKTYMAILLIIS